MAQLYENGTDLFFSTGLLLLLSGLFFGVAGFRLFLSRQASGCWAALLLAAAILQFVFGFADQDELPAKLLFGMYQSALAGLFLCGMALLHADRRISARIWIWAIGSAVSVAAAFILVSEHAASIWVAVLYLLQAAASFSAIYNRNSQDKNNDGSTSALLLYAIVCAAAGIFALTGRNQTVVPILQPIGLLAVLLAVTASVYSRRKGPTDGWLAAALDASSQAAAILAFDGKVLRVNRNMQTLFCAADSSAAREQLRSLLAQMGKLDEPCVGREVRISPQGDAMRLAVTAQKLNWPDGVSAGWLVCAERLDDEMDAVVSQQNSNLLLSFLGAYPFRWEETLFVSPGLLRNMGYGVDSMEFDQLRTLMHPQDRPLQEWYPQRKPREQETPVTIDFQLKNSVGDFTWYRAAVTPARHGNDRQGILWNIDREKGMERFLAQGEKFATLGQLTSGIAHDMNNHLMTIQTSLGLLNKVADETLRRKYSAYMQEALNNAISMLKRMLSFSKGEEDYRLIEMNTLVSSSLDLLERAVSHKVALRLDIRSELQLVWGNYFELQNIILNIGLNARDALPIAGGAIAVTTWTAETNPAKPEVSARWYCISIRDNGTGMPPEVQKRIFEPFFTTKPTGKGSGLGLFISHGTVQRHGGTISVESESDVGTEFRICIPLARENFTKCAQEIKSASNH